MFLKAGKVGKSALSGLLLGLLAAAGLPGVARGAAADLQVSPDVVEIGAFFHGHKVIVTARIPAGSEAVMEVKGKADTEHMLRKGRRGGLWMNVGEIDFQGAPSVYLAASTDPKLLTAAPPEAAWGYQALRQRIKISGEVQPAEQEEFLGQFFKLKESEDIYRLLPGGLKASKAAGDLKTVTGRFAVPTNIKPGAYEVCLSVIDNGTLAAKNCTDLKVEMVGFPAMLDNMAHQHGATYGILAVVIAIVTGFAMGFLFKGGGGH